MGERSVGFGYSMIQITVEPKQGAVSGRRSFRYGSRRDSDDWSRAGPTRRAGRSRNRDIGLLFHPLRLSGILAHGESSVAH